jgi:hypothetical protein
MLKRTLSFATALAAVSFMGLGCNPLASVQQKVNDKIAEGVVNQATGGKVSVDTSKDQVVFKDNKTGGSMAFGENVTIPDNFPKDVPVYPGARAIGIVMQQDGSKDSVLTLKSDDDVAKVMAWYADRLKADWKEDSSFTANNVEIRAYSKTSAKLSLTISPGDNDKGSVISLSYSPQQ